MNSLLHRRNQISHLEYLQGRVFIILDSLREIFKIAYQKSEKMLSIGELNYEGCYIYNLLTILSLKDYEIIYIIVCAFNFTKVISNIYCISVYQDCLSECP